MSVDSFTLKANSKKNTVIKLRKAGKQDIAVPAFFINAQVSGSKDDLETAYFSGVGEKTRYGFGLLVPAK